MSDDDQDDPKRGERIAKWLARAGVASRRDAEKMIAEGRVKLGGKVVETPATFITPGDHVTVDGKQVAAPERTRLFRYHKPDGLVTTHRDPEGRATVFERLPAGLPRLVSVGRLDITSEGLLLLTNDGELARKLELPSNGWLRRYRVRVHGRVDEQALAGLVRGITIDGVVYGPIEAGLDARQGTNSWLTVSIKEGKNREVRRVMAHLGLDVTRLIRTAYGPFQLGALPRGAVEEVNAKVLRDQLGLDAPKRLREVAQTVVTEEAPPEGPRRAPRARNASMGSRRPVHGRAGRKPRET
uniref:pseudouridine synthase n=1 Tax=Neoroseomonas terrae TaxID=424799 RepID=UPI0030B9E0AB